ncbi:MAG: DUF3426 domain-containing protein, partial [Chloroflexota bacterium]|nr:DUF3426 domain-containing protein [Chloroflexota bacterium]
LPLAQGLVIQNDNASPPRDEYAPYTITGQVKNTGNAPAESVSILAIAYDKAGKPVAVQQGYAERERIGPGKTSPFSVAIYDESQTIAKYELYVEGMEAE